MDQNTEMYKKEYKIPWSRFIQFILTVIGFLGFLISLILIPIVIGIYGSLLLLFLIPFLILGLSFFILISFWMNVMTYPIRKWILSDINCPKCKSSFTKCEYAFGPGLSFFRFAVCCEDCKKVDIIETGIIDKTLRFSLLRDIALDYEMKYFGGGYKVPLIVWVLFYFFLVISPTIGLVVVIGIPIMLFFWFYGGGRSVGQDRWEIIKLLIFLLLLVLDYKILKESKKIRNFETYPLRKWILNNIKCPDCGNLFTKCDTMPDITLLKYKVHCEYCNKERLIGIPIGSFNWLLRFMKE